MGAESILRLRGRLCADPTDLNQAFPHGGKALGLTRAAVFRYGIRTAAVEAEEFGMVATEVVLSGFSAVLAAILRDFDDEFLSRVFPQTVVGGTSGRRLLQGDLAGSTPPGSLLSSKSFKLLFSPLDQERSPFVLLYNALPLVEETAELQLSAAQEGELAAMFLAAANTNKRVYQVGRRADLDLAGA